MKQIEQQTEKLLYNSFKNYKFYLEFSKVLAIGFFLVYCLTWLMCFISFFKTNIYPYEILDFVLQPTLIMCGFYFAKSTIENISKGVCDYFYNKLKIQKSEATYYNEYQNDHFIETNYKGEN